MKVEGRGDVADVTVLRSCCGAETCWASFDVGAIGFMLAPVIAGAGTESWAAYGSEAWRPGGAAAEGAGPVEDDAAVEAFVRAVALVAIVCLRCVVKPFFSSFVLPLLALPIL